ncbi:MAG: SDR family NAD(P)-dependent oxidoreductase [Deltaproteobacteria bacterium]|nr:SDR family NAD(P)-dependent oxidoreductase [Deltaproteobacteria bacterium]
MANENDIAIVGMACRLPGARNPRELWHNLKNGVESVRQYTEQELLEAGVKKETLRRKEYIRSGAPLEKMEFFDGEFFGFSAKESAILDPQHRQFLECTWEALEDAGHPPETFEGAIGVFAGCGMGSYFMFNLLSNPELVRNVGLFLLRHTGNDKDFLATRLSYLLDLRGPSISVQTACSTSLVAVHLAAQHLLSGECDMAIAGGVTIEIPHRRGYHYAEGEILSPDGHCRAFDHRSAGTIFGSGAGVVVLRRLKDALADGDVIHAVVRSTAVNNDGSQKVGYLAPSVDGQAACVAEALALADVAPDSLQYIECHGTGTAMGDPIEVAALTQAFREGTDKKQFCGIGSIKTNIGHLDTAAGVASIIKATLSLEHQAMAPSLNWEKPNPQIDFGSSPFFVNHKLREWKAGATPRRAGVNSLGVGGTNAFAILEEAPQRPAGTASKRPAQLLVMSARNRAALDDGARALAQHLRDHPELDLADVAWTLQVGRRAFAERRVLAASSREEAIELLEKLDPKRVFTHTAAPGKGGDKRSVAFLFPGGGAQYPRMAKDLYDKEPVFKRHMDDGFAKLRARHGVDLLPLLFCAPEDKDRAASELEKPGLQLPAIFLVEYALAQLFLSWGIKPTALLGHSMGENTAACISGTISFDDCLGLVALRGRLMDGVAPGGMLSVPMTTLELRPLLEEIGLDLATVNAPDLCVASGSNEKLSILEAKLKARGVDAQRVKIHIAAHSRLLEGILEEFGSYLRSIKLSAPKIPWVSNRTGTWITTEQATSASYWVEHLRNTVLFADGVGVLAEDPGRVFLEVGPGKTLSSLAKMHSAVRPSQACIASLRHPDDTIDDGHLFLATLGRLWAAGGSLPTQKLFEGEQRRRVSLPAYAFQSIRYFIEPGKGKQDEEGAADILEKQPDLERWFYEPRWKRRDADDGELGKQTWLVFMDNAGVGRRLVERLEARGDDVVTVSVGDSYQKRSERTFVLAPEHGRTAYDSLTRDLVQQGTVPDRVVHLWLLAAEEEFRPGSSFFHRNQERGFYSLLFFAQAWSAEAPKKNLHVVVATTGMQQVARDGATDEVRYPEQATVLGPALVLPRELPGATVSVVDIDVQAVMRERTALEQVGDLVHALDDSPLAPALDVLRTRAPTLLERTQAAAPIEPVVDGLTAEVLAPAENVIVAHRAGRRYVQELRRVELPQGGAMPLREGGVVLVTGGLGGIGMELAEHLARTKKARLALLSRAPLPERSQWPNVTSKLGPDHPTSRRIARVEALERSGAEVLVLAGDVTDVERMTAVVAEIRARFGGVNAVVHAAGVVKDALLSQKSQADVEEVLAPKVYGTLILDRVTKNEDLDLFVVFSSTSTVIAPAGQVDYVAANAFLNAFAHARQKAGKGRTLALNWGVWNEVGMAADAASRMMGGAAPGGEPTDHPWFDRKVTDEKGVVSIFARWSPQSHWMLDEHRTREGEALLPGAGYLELCRAALAEIGLNRPFEIRALTFFRPFEVEDGSTRTARIRLTPNEQGYLFEVAEHVALEGAAVEGAAAPGRTGWRKTAQASLWLHRQRTPTPIDVAAVEARAIGNLPHRSKQEDHLRFGPRWRVVTLARRTGPHEAFARLELPESYAPDVHQIALHPALVDLGTGFAMDLIDGYSGNTLWVPVSYRSARIFGALPRSLISVVRTRPGSNEAHGFAHFDVTLCDEKGRVLVEVEELTIKRLDGKLDLQRNRRVAPSDVELDAAVRQESQLSPVELAFRHNLAEGIAPSEGTRAFDRATTSYPGAQVYVSSLDLKALAEQSRRVLQGSSSAEGADAGTQFARPQLSSEYLAPRDDTEGTLVPIWEELLGVSGIGVRDSFFDLGGHSLIAVRLFAKVKKSFGVEFPISVLFEAPTIEGCAALIRQALPKGGDGPLEGADVERAPEAATRPRYRHLVAMHAGEGGPRSPFFLCAGMFGNVLNLRHLAHQLSTDRPFYGLQARGLFGGEEPHHTFEQMARDYLAEVRLVQPKGPYYLGGFSGGGIAALEMARQLIEVGEEIALLVMLDTPLPTSVELTRADKMKMHLQNARRRGPGYAADLMKTRVGWELRKWRDRNYDGSDTQAGALHSKEIELAFYRALKIYEVQRHPGVISLFRPKLQPIHVFGPGRMINRDRRFIYEDNGWGPYCDHVEVVEVPGDHDSMVLEPNVRVLAARLRDQLLAAEKKARGATIVPVVDQHAAK